MKELKVKDVVEGLLKLDQEMPFFYHTSGGEFLPFLEETPDNPYLKTFGLVELAEAKNEPFFVMTKDTFYKKNKESFKKPFNAVAVY